MSDIDTINREAFETFRSTVEGMFPVVTKEAVTNPNPKSSSSPASKKMSKEITSGTREIADKIKENSPTLTIENKMGYREIDPTFYTKFLHQNDLTVKTVEALQNAHGKLTSAGGLAAGELAIDDMKEHKDLESVIVKIPGVGKDYFQYNVTREYTKRNPSNGETTQAFGKLTAEHHEHDIRRPSDWTAVKNHLADLAEKSLKK